LSCLVADYLLLLTAEKKAAARIRTSNTATTSWPRSTFRDDASMAADSGAGVVEVLAVVEMTGAVDVEPAVLFDRGLEVAGVPALLPEALCAVEAGAEGLIEGWSELRRLVTTIGSSIAKRSKAAKTPARRYSSGEKE
jgi:hypothetical protein